MKDLFLIITPCRGWKCAKADLMSLDDAILAAHRLVRGQAAPECKAVEIVDITGKVYARFERKGGKE